MLADFVLKGIDNLFNQKLTLQKKKKVFTKDTIKQNIENVIRRPNFNINSSINSGSKNTQNIASHHVRVNVSPNMNKSRLRYILQHNKQQKIRSVIKKNKNDRSNSPSPYTKIQYTPTKSNLFNSSMKSSNTNSMIQIKKSQSLITFYRQQRKNIDKSRISQNNSVLSQKRSSIFREKDDSHFEQQKVVEKQMIRVPSFKKFFPRN